MSLIESSSSKIDVRANIENYISEDLQGGLYLHKEPLDFNEEGFCISDKRTVVIDLPELLSRLGIPSPVEYDVFYQVCEMVLQREEANPGSMFSIKAE